MKFKGLILTFNEEISIKNCVLSLNSICDEIILVDSYSTDSTVSIARSLGCKVVFNTFTSFSAQRNFALTLFETGDFVIMLDADERLSEEAKNELSSIPDLNLYNAILIRRRDIYQDTWIKKSSGYPLLFIRGFRVGFLEISREINEHYKVIGNSFCCKNDLIHYPLIKGEYNWLSKHMKYAQMEANQILMGNKIYSSKFRHVVKNIIYRLPALKIFILWVYYFCFRLCFLDGKAGIKYVRGKLLYERMINYFIHIKK